MELKLRTVPGFLPTVLSTSEESSSIATPTNGHGYIQFDINEEPPRPTVRREKKPKSKKDTVNEVLFSLFPNGFSDIFRFSGSEANTEAATDAPSTSETTTNKAVVHATTATESSANTEPVTLPPKNETFYSYQTTVTKEYRRELRPGHTQIVVEKISSAEREPFTDGSNHISRDELLRINRAAVASPVLPSLLLRPEIEGEDNETLVAAESAPIVILGEQETELEEGQSIEDNQIAESRHMDQQLYQQLLPAPARDVDSSSHTIESYRSQEGPADHQQINVHIVHDESQAKVPEAPESQPQQALDHFQAHSEQRFQQHHQTQEAPSRQFLKTFKPIISGSADRPIPKGTFHYESNNPPARTISNPPKEVAYEGPFVRPAAQLSYQQELSPQKPEPEPQAPQSKLNTQAIASPSSAAAPAPKPSEHSNYGGPTPSSLVYVTVNSHSPTAAAPAAHQAEEQAVPQLPSPHDYVSEAAAEPSQHHIQHAPAPKSHLNTHSQPETQLLVKPNGYTFVEVQKSVNIHNKLITEKDGRLVEMHETIYHPPPYQQNHFSVTSSGYSPKDFVSAASPETAPAPAPAPAPPPSATNYVSLAANPINVEQVEYDSAPQEGAISHAAINIDVPHQPRGHDATHDAHHEAPHHHPVTVVEKHSPQPYPVPVEKIIERPVKEIVERHIPVPYAVPQPVPVPVHVEHYVDRPYPVETIVEQPVPYPVETIVEKIVEKQVPVEVERIVEKPVEVEKIVEKYIDRPMAIPIHVPVAIHMPMPPNHSPGFNFGSHPNALHPWTHASVAHIPPKVLQHYYTRMLKKLLPQLAAPQTTAKTASKTTAKAALVKPPVRPVRGEAPKVATFSLADMRFDLRPPPPPQGSPWLQGARYIYNTLPDDLSVAAASAPAHMVKSYIGPVPTTSTSSENNGSEFDEFQRWRNGHSLKRSPDFGRNLHLEYGFKPPLVPSVEIDDKGMPLKQADAAVQ
ncbi:inactive histone-lysine N-methyltransferase 2E [Drosophila montana]|uniref:inactive histone-lysine N-methyltransferase 2E n=1 Tax=Drosophila montana TaxID=40370 RepID=UPI00313BA0C7